MIKISKRWVTICGIIVLLISFLFVIPPNFVRGDLSIIITVCTFILSILLGFFMATSLSNYLNLQLLIAEETAGLIALFHAYQLVDKKLAEEVRLRIDEYVIYSFDFELSEYVDNSWSSFNKIIDVAQKIKIKDGAIFGNILDIHKKLLINRQKTNVCSRKIMNFSNWFILIILSIAQLLLIYSVRSESFLSILITIILSLANILALILLKDLDSNTFAETQFAFNIFQKVFVETGSLPYYTDFDIQTGRVIPKERVYRVGKSSEKFYAVENRKIEIIDINNIKNQTKF